MNYLDILHAQLRIDEAVREKPYVDTTGHLTIGCGRNLTANGVSRGEIALMFDNDLATAEHAARLLIDNFDHLSDVRKAVVINMAFNMGYATLSTFVTTLKSLEEGRFVDAASGMLASKWAGQVGNRALRLAESMRTNQWKGPT